MENKKNIMIDITSFIALQKSFLQDCTTRNPKTLCTYRVALQSFQKFLQSNNLNVINIASLNKFRDYLLQTKKLKENTVHTYFTGLSRFFHYLIKRRIINYNPVKDIKYKITKKNSKIRFFTHNQIDKIISGIDDTTIHGLRDIALIHIITQTGLKESKVINLKIKHLIHYGKYWYLQFHEANNSKYNTKIRLSNSLIAALETYFKQRGVSLKHKEEHLFISNSNRSKNQQISERSIREIVKRRIQNSSLKKKHKNKLTPVTLRNTGIINVIARINSRDQIKEFFGIKLDSTLDRYLELAKAISK